MSRVGNIERTDPQTFGVEASGAHYGYTLGTWMMFYNSSGHNKVEKYVASESAREHVAGVIDAGASAGGIDTIRTTGVVYMVTSTAMSAGAFLEPGQDHSTVRISRGLYHYAVILDGTLSAASTAVITIPGIENVYAISSLLLQSKDSAPIQLTESTGGTIVSTSLKWCYSGSAYSTVRIEKALTANEILHVAYFKKQRPKHFGGQAITNAAGTGSTVKVRLI
jgi:hypothetical protein